MAVKVTFTLDEATIERLQRAAGRLRKPKSAIVREAIREYEAKADRLSETERQRLLQALDRFGAQPPARPQSDVEKELAEIRWVRRHGGRLHPPE